MQSPGPYSVTNVAVVSSRRVPKLSRFSIPKLFSKEVLQFLTILGINPLASEIARIVHKYKSRCYGALYFGYNRGLFRATMSILKKWEGIPSLLWRNLAISLKTFPGDISREGMTFELIGHARCCHKSHYVVTRLMKSALFFVLFGPLIMLSNSLQG